VDDPLWVAEGRYNTNPVAFVLIPLLVDDPLWAFGESTGKMRWDES